MSDDKLNVDEDLLDAYPPGDSFWGVVVGVVAQAAFLGAILAVTSPLWVPAAIYNRIKQTFEPKPVYRGTVRPLVPLAETKSRKAHAR